jgi:hypothetical protein
MQLTAAGDSLPPGRSSQTAGHQVRNCRMQIQQRACTHTHTHIHIYVYTYTCIHIYIHTHTTCRTHAFPRPALRQHLRDANIKDMDENSVAKKLQERLSANIFSYLQLAALKIKPNTSMHQHKQLETQKARTEYASSLSELVASIHD